MHIATEKTIKQVTEAKHNGGMGATRTWNFLARWFLACIFATVIADHSVRGDEAWHDRAIGGGRVRFTGRANPCSNGGVHSAAARRMIHGKGSWLLYGPDGNNGTEEGNVMLRTSTATSHLLIPVADPQMMIFLVLLESVGDLIRL